MFHFKGNFSDFEKDCLSQQIQKFQLKANGKLGDAAVSTFFFSTFFEAGFILN